MYKDINEKPFDESTRLKLQIFEECFREWFPVFIFSDWCKKIYIFDFFAGSGIDVNKVKGSPLVLLNEAIEYKWPPNKNVKKPVTFVFNDSSKSKSHELKKNIKEFISNCKLGIPSGRYGYKCLVLQHEFKDLFQQKKILKVLNDKNCGKFILLDQYGFKQIDDDIFKKLVSFPKTDFIFFISSSFVKRFKEHPYVKKYFNTKELSFEESKPKECHSIIAQYFKRSAPDNYYIHHFSIRKEKGGNYYGLIFGTSHSLGMEKFLKVCWKKDPNSGESNFNIDEDFGPTELFYNPNSSNKKDRIKRLLRKKILEGRIEDNITGLECTMRKGCRPSLFVEVIKSLEKDGKIKLMGNINYTSTNIHRIKKPFTIELTS